MCYLASAELIAQRGGREQGRERGGWGKKWIEKKKRGKLWVTGGEGRKERQRRIEAIYLHFPYHVYFSWKRKIFWKCLYGSCRFYWMSSYLIVLVVEKFLFLVRNSSQAAIYPKVSGIFLKNYIVQYTYMDLGSSGPILYLLHRWATMLIVSVLK